MEPNTDENMPRQMRAMIQLALEGSETSMEAITKMWLGTQEGLVGDFWLAGHNARKRQYLERAPWGRSACELDAVGT